MSEKCYAMNGADDGTVICFEDQESARFVEEIVGYNELGYGRAYPVCPVMFFTLEELNNYTDREYTEEMFTIVPTDLVNKLRTTYEDFDEDDDDNDELEEIYEEITSEYCLFPDDLSEN